MVIEMDILKTLLLSVVLLLVGKKVRQLFPVFAKYCIPSAVIGGLLFSVLTLILYSANIVTFTFDGTLQTFFMNVFFAASGCAASMSLLKKGGVKVGIFIVLAAVLAFLQNVVAVGVGGLMGVSPLIALMTGSTPMTGGHGNAASFAPIAEGFGATGAMSVAVAAATFGLVSGCIMGGPIGNRLILKGNLDKGYVSEDAGSVQEKAKKVYVNKERTLTAIFIVSISVGLGSFIFDFAKVALPGVTLPIHVMCMLAGVIVRMVYDAVAKPQDEALYDDIDAVGDVSLGFFVTMAIMTMKLWQLAELALPLLVMLVAQCVLIYFFATMITFRAMGKDYDAAVMAVGHVGFGLGAVPVSMTTMKTVCDKFHYSRIAFFVVPIVGGLFSNFTNAAIITAFLNYFK